MNTLSKRLVLSFPGFEGTGPLHQFDRMKAGMERFAKVWNLTCEAGASTHHEEHHFAETSVVCRTDNGKTETRFVHFVWADIIHKYSEGRYPFNFLARMPAYGSFFIYGTVFAYFRAHWRYGMFAIYPLLFMIPAALVAWGLAALVSYAVGTGAFVAFLTFILGAGLFLAFLRWPGDRYYVPLSVYDWAFARHFCNLGNPEITRRINQFAKTMTAEIVASDADEIVISTNSLGTPWAVAAIAIALTDNPKLFDRHKVTILAFGSSLMKINLDRQSVKMRQWTTQVLSDPRLIWSEYQTLSDVVAFHRTTPARDIALKAPHADIRIHEFRFSKVIEPERYQRIRRSFFRLHRQYILPQDKRCHFEYFLLCFGPLPTHQLACNPEIIHRLDSHQAA